MSKKDKAQPVTPATVSSPVILSLPERFDKYPLWHYIILLVVPFFIYIKTTGFDFINMDEINIIYVNLETLLHWKNAGLAFKTNIFLAPHGNFYSPMQTVSFMLDAAISRERTWMYHLSNLIYHLLTVASLYSLLRFLRFRNIAAFLAAFFFAIHPLLTSAVSWVPARGDVMAGLWSILALLSFTKYTRSRNWVHFILHTIFFLLAVFSKGACILLPAVLLWFYFFVLREKFNTKTVLPFLFVWLASIACFLILRQKVTGAGDADGIFGIGALAENLAVIPVLFAKIFIPVNLSTMPLVENNFMLAGTVMLAVAAFACVYKAGKKNWLPLTGLVWFLLFIIPGLFFKTDYSKFLVQYYEQAAYLPMAGIMILLASAVNDRLNKRFDARLAWAALAFCIILVPLASVHSDHFKNSTAFFTRAADLNNPGAYTKRGEQYFNNKDFGEAMDDFEKAIEISDGQYPFAYINHSRTAGTFRKDHNMAESDLSQAIRLDTTIIEAYIFRASERISLGNVPGAKADLEKAKKINANNADIYDIAGKAEVTSKNYAGAVAGFSKAIELNKNFTEAYADRAFVYYQLKNYPAAIKDCDETIRQNHAFFNAYYNKGMIYYDMGKTDEAIKLFDSTLTVADNFYFGYFYRGMAKKRKNDMAGACNDWQESVKLGFAMAQDTISRYCK